MNEKKKQSRSYSRRKVPYAPIMLTSKAFKPLQRESLNEFNNQQKSQKPHKFRLKLSKFTKNSQIQLLRKLLFSQNILDIQKLNMTQNNIRNSEKLELDKSFSYSSRKTRFMQVNASQFISNNQKQGIDQLYYERSNKYQREIQTFYMRQPTSSAVVNVEFNNKNLGQKISRKNNSRYNIQFTYGNGSPNANRPHKSFSTNSKPCRKNQIKDGQEVIIEINDDKQFNLMSSSMRKNICLSANKQIQKNILKKDSNQKLILLHKTNQFDHTFTNFKQKIYEKKLNKLSNKKTKYNEEWNEYLNKYYLNIKKVKPLAKYEGNQSYHALQQKNQNISNHPYKQNLLGNIVVSRQAKSSVQLLLNEINQNKINVVQKMVNIQEESSDQICSQKMNRIKSNTCMTSSKTTTALSSVDFSPQFFQNKPHKLYQNDSNQNKIQTDIITKRINSNRKDYFVFSMGDSSNQNKIQNPNLIKFNLYKDFLWKVNFSNGLYVRLPDDIQKPYKFFVGKGNNSGIIKGIMRRRFWWQLVDKISPDVNFVWTQLKINDFVKSQKKRKNQQLKHLLDSNRPYEHNVPSNCQQQLVDQNFQQSNQMNKKIFKRADLSLWLSYMKHHSKHEQKFIHQAGYNILQKRLKPMIKKKKILYLDSLVTAQQKSHNHFECNYYIGNKKALFYAMRKYYKIYGQDPFEFIPLTYHINGGLQDPEFDQFLQRYNSLNEQRMKNKNSDIKNIWIVKPGEVTNRGKGITVCATLDEIKIRLKSKQKNSDGSLRTYILQKYIQKPLLYQKRKFDIRHYMLMTCINGKIKGYWYQQGYIRTTSTEYNIKNCKDLYTHLTNDAIQKNSADYGKYQKGNKISYQEFQKYLIKNYRKDFDFFQQILPKMKKSATDAIRATYAIIQPNRRQNNFELFGLDFMLDQNMKVYLIECNTNPCLQLSCPLLGKIISGLIENVFKICIDPIFPPPYEWPNAKKFQMGENSLNEMKFEIVFDEACDGRQLQKFYGRQKGFGNKIGKVEQQQEEYEDDKAEEEWNEDQTS